MWGATCENALPGIALHDRTVMIERRMALYCSVIDGGSKLPTEREGRRTIGPAIQHGEAISPRILLIDDEERILNFVSRGLRREGFAVDVAAEGSEGLRLATSESYDLVILDLLMPGLDGKAV